MYRVIGADGREYGPISADQLRQWIAENRANAATRVRGEASTEWKTLGSLPEFSLLLSATASQSSTPAVYSTTASTAQRTNGFAAAGFIFGILSFFGLPFSLLCCCFAPVFNFLGIIFSVIGLSQIRRSPQIYGGKGLAVGGLVLSMFCLAVYLIWAVFEIIYSQSRSGFPHHAYRL